MGLTTDPNDPALKRNAEGGMNEKYLVLSEEERAKGFARPVYRAYIHHPLKPEWPLRPLNEEELKRELDTKYGYAAYEEYPPSDSSVLGRFWTQEQLDRGERGCGAVTTMGLALCETYARDPNFYGATYCAGCKAHHPVGENGEFNWVVGGEDTGIKVGT